MVHARSYDRLLGVCQSRLLLQYFVLAVNLIKFDEIIQFIHLKVHTNNSENELKKWLTTVKCLLWSIELISNMSSIAIIVWHVMLLAELIVLCVLVELIVLSVLIELIILHIWHPRWKRCWQEP